MLGQRLRALSAGISGGLDTQTVTTGAGGTVIDQSRYRGYILSDIGSISDGLSDIYGGTAISSLYWDENGGAAFYYLNIPGATNDSWETITIGSVTLYRSAASFSAGAWQWFTAHTAGSQAFGSNSSIKTVTFA